VPVRRYVQVLHIAIAAAAAPARADVGARLSISSMFLSESSTGAGDAADASNEKILYGDLRGVVEGRRLPFGLEAKGDFRLRLTSDFSEARAFTGDAQISARGYRAGPEYDLRELYVIRRGDSVDLGVGRIIIRESDALVLDGARGWWRFHPAWHASLFAGLYPNPFSRSLTDDYVAPAAAFGGDVAYAFPRVWGSASVAGAWLGGPDDGGAINPANPGPAVPANRTEAARIYVTWNNYLRALDRGDLQLDLFHDLVVDVAGAAGPTLTRLDAGGQLLLGRLRLTAGYGHLSSLAIEMYLARLLRFYDRGTFATGILQNNLVLQRTARDEGRLAASVRPIGKLDVYGEARLRQRGLLAPAEDPNFATAPADPLAWDLTVGARDAGDLFGVRLALALTWITDHRAETQLLTFDAGRDFLDERLTIDATVAVENNHDFGATMSATCPAGMPLALGCFGHRNGQVWQAGATLGLRPIPRLFVLGDYRFVLDTADGGGQTIATHVAFLRIELRL
jgi:hypothetical protein